ncbi:type II toxin-antitoxin system VapC family toxin [Methylocystis sp. Sn-Cys]|uniref:type II toxin-antitoxin system VapC family toxin n=1 Tax=Methylocystis sp. Sn-Cys TaxID=1701263 RepID=UPI00351C6280
MIFLDASAVIAILNREPDSERLITAIEEARGQLNISPISTFESVLGLARARIGAPARRSAAEDLRLATASVREFIRANDIREISISPEIGQGAILAAATYGKAVGHPADLNFGDCFAYSCAKALGATLLYKGDDFTKTDLGG